MAGAAGSLKPYLFAQSSWTSHAQEPHRRGAAPGSLGRFASSCSALPLSKVSCNLAVAHADPSLPQRCFESAWLRAAELPTPGARAPTCHLNPRQPLKPARQRAPCLSVEGVLESQEPAAFQLALGLEKLERLLLSLSACAWAGDQNLLGAPTSKGTQLRKLSSPIAALPKSKAHRSQIASAPLARCTLFHMRTGGMQGA